MGRKKKEEMKKEEIAEDYCFFCKDGGHLRVCDYGYCLKAYHPECVGKDDSFLESGSGDHWTCRWHSCFNCQRAAKYYCFCCPNAVCKFCLGKSEFVIVKRNHGLCDHCLKLAQLIEENKNVDCDGVKIDFEDQDTYECLFKSYWITQKEKEGLTLEHIRVAANPSGRSKNAECDYEDDYSDDESSLDYSDSDDLNYMEDKKMSGRRKRSEKKRNFAREQVYKKKTNFIGWASESLVEFLTSIGRDVTTKLSQHEVISIITHYCEEMKLFQPDKKKNILCDAKLHSLLRRKSINKNRLHSALESHFAENWEQSEDDEDTSSNGTDDSGSVPCKRQKNPTLDGGSQKDLSEARKCLFASIVPQNIKLAYLNKSLVEELLMQPELFESKVVGCFVRVKADPNDFMQKNSHQLLRVTGVKRSSTTGESGTGIVLQVPYMVHDITICKLSDDDFSEEECEDLRQRMITGLLRRPTVLELEQKARSLHVDKTKHWIQRELVRLQRLIDRANEKGWRSEFQQYFERRELLQNPSEQSRLLNTFPEVIADTEDLQPVVNENVNHNSDTGTLQSAANEKDNHGLQESTPINGNEDAAEEIGDSEEPALNEKETRDFQEPIQMNENEDAAEEIRDTEEPALNKNENYDFQEAIQMNGYEDAAVQGQPNEENPLDNEVIHDSTEIHSKNQRDVKQVKVKGWSAGVEVIDLSDDEEIETTDKDTPENPDSDI